MKKTTEMNLIPAVIYARYSSQGQREESIEGQLRECRHWAEQNGYSVIGEYCDKAKTGRSDNRPEFQRMIKDSNKHLFQAVICWKVDRFARNRYDSAMYKAKLRKNDVQVVYAMETIADGAEGIVLESLLEGMAEYYSANLSENVKRGNYDSALEYKTLGHPMLGYTIDSTSHYQIDPNTAPIVRRIFEEYASEKPTVQICKDLNNDGCRTLRGGLFNNSSITRIVQNEKYIGTYRYMDIYAENVIPAIVSKELFQKCQPIITKRKTAPAASRNAHYILVPKLHCGLCGSPMTGESANSRGQVYYYYSCAAMRKHHTCKKKRVNKDLLEQIVVNAVFDAINDEEFITEFVDRLLEYARKQNDGSMLLVLEDRKKDVEKAIRNLLSLLESGLESASIKSRLIELESELKSLEKSIAREQMEKPHYSEDEIRWWFHQLRSGGIKEDETFCSQLIESLVNSIYLYEDKIIIVFNHSGSNNKITLKNIKDLLKESGTSSLEASAAPNALNTNHLQVVNGLIAIIMPMA